jgi:hypothetical protein
MFFSSALQVVFKSTGGRIWNKRWGLPKLTRTRKENRKKDIRLFNQNIEILKAAEYLQPEVPVRLAQPLPGWQREQMKKRLEQAQVLLNSRGTLLPAAAAEAMMQQWLQKSEQQQQQRHQRSLEPPSDPQQQQHHLRRQVRPKVRK